MQCMQLDVGDLLPVCDSEFHLLCCGTQGDRICTRDESRINICTCKYKTIIAQDLFKAVRKKDVFAKTTVNNVKVTISS